MKNILARAACLLALILYAPLAPSQFPQDRQVPPSETPSETRLPNGKLQRDEILKAEHERSVKDAAQLIELAESLKAELEKDDTHVLSISSLKKTEEIEKIARRIRSRIKRL
ncbi:MAG TPA: hypothetical protein VLX58_06275 [Bryobacteraceae bacterium]|nr:hypothetical protein [Bryobacteraceae bacterium]